MFPFAFFVISVSSWKALTKRSVTKESKLSITCPLWRARLREP